LGAHFNQRIILEPDEKECLTFALATRDDVEEIMFPRAGQYGFHLKYYGMADRPANRQPIERLTVYVTEPEGVDATIYRLLDANPRLAKAMIARHTLSSELPDGATVSLLERIVLRYPRSSYADYARFALARVYLGGNDKITKASEDAKHAARALLEAIDYKRFAFAPTAQYWLKGITVDPAKVAKIQAILETDFADSIEFLAEQAETITTEQWVKIREGAILRGPRKPKP
jgi:hypothetical protein